MVLAEEEPRQARPNLPWRWAAVVGVVVLLGVGLWAALRGRGTPAPESVVVASDSIAATAVPRDSLEVDSTASDAAEAQATAMATTDATAAISAPPVAARPIPTPAPAPASQLTPRRDPALAPPPAPRSEPARGDTVYRATTWVWLRAGPVNSAEQLGVVNPRQEVLILERRFAWVRVRVDGQEGWMSADFLERVPE